MFLKDYFASTYWPGTYWPGAGSGGSAAVPADLLEAVIARLAADATVAADLPGGVYSDRAPASDDVATPYLVIVDPEDSTTTGTTTLGDYYDSGTLQFDVFVEQTDAYEAKDRARKVAWDVADALNDAPLVFLRGELVYFRQQAAPVGDRDPDPGPNGLPVYIQRLTMDYTVGRSFAR